MLEKYQKNKYFSIGLMLFLMLISTVLSFIFFKIADVNTANIALIYILALILTARYTDGYWYGIIFALFSVICINYFFTYPYFTLNFTLSGYPVSFILTLTITLLTSATTSHLKIQAAMLAEREEIINKAEKEKMRANLLRAVSHDLRTPLTSIIGTSDSYLELPDSLNDEEKTALVQQINEDANWLLNMVENLLSVTRIKDSDSARVNKSPEVVEEVISEAVLRFKKRHPESSVKVSIPEDYIILPMDPLLIEQVIINLLDNACVHSSSQKPIDLTVIDSPSSVVFCIRDYGKGIDPELLPTIFDGNSARNTASPDAHRGMGIGLSICKTIISAHAGSITALNHDKGAEFMFTLPKED
ncbi:MAG: DUF4118 domain-containing protein [Lachnoclostridium sp.]